ncbi:MAG: CpaF family protein [Endomicrobium sp.]|jgi:pilus assembly protein CpaF|nr:CpaF family protein [Endomicrobium sp.]
MFLIAPSCDVLKRAVIANGLSSISSIRAKENIIIDFSVVSTEAFWSVYKNGMKYIEDIFPVLPALNPKMLKSFLSPGTADLVLGLKNKKLKELDHESVLYLINALSQGYESVFVILPDDISGNLLFLVKNSTAVLFPFLSDSISSKNAVSIYETILSASNCQLNSIPLKLDLGYEFHSDKILSNYELFKNPISAAFSPYVQEQILSPKYSYRDKTNSIVKALSAVLEKPCAKAAEISPENYFQKEDVYVQLRDKIYSELVEKMKEFSDEADPEKLKRHARSKIEEILKRLDLKLAQNTAERLYKDLCDDVAGLGILEDFLKDPQITEIMVNGPDMIYIEKAGKLTLSNASFSDEKRLKTVIDRIVSQIGRHIDESSPIVDARLKDGSRVNAVIRPISLVGPVLTIRKFLKSKLSPSQLISSSSISYEMTEFLKAAVLLKRNIIISGGTGTGKTTLLNAVSSFIPENERLVTIEDSAELQLQQKHVVRLESRPKSTEGSGEITIRRLVVNALRMRPDRIIVGECRAGEALDMLQAMTTGHEGSMSTVHANSAKDAVSRFVTMVLMSGADLPERSIIAQIASAVNVIAQLTRYGDGTRKISSISVLNLTGDDKIYEVIPVFEFKTQSVENGVQKGVFKASGYIPDFIKKASERGIEVDTKIFNV